MTGRRGGSRPRSSSAGDPGARSEWTDPRAGSRPGRLRELVAVASPTAAQAGGGSRIRPTGLRRWPTTGAPTPPRACSGRWRVARTPTRDAVDEPRALHHPVGRRRLRYPPGDRDRWSQPGSRDDRAACLADALDGRTDMAGGGRPAERQDGPDTGHRSILARAEHSRPGGRTGRSLATTPAPVVRAPHRHRLTENARPEREIGRVPALMAGPGSPGGWPRPWPRPPPVPWRAGIAGRPAARAATRRRPRCRGWRAGGRRPGRGAGAR
ncbi:hypothetical protein CLV40_11377 [Actinokineospora auranticolor]|uniref:Uncharacterized protein n=1 Tax=Actinokineospora auranticolor TaxID=155976 RepID=A0A2S6GK62_9PSEU|nr:hypothetical protein CLV40_11377 [Actinokineospora auranticolor]